jgi:protein O-mannosyl-transferase
MSKKTDKLKARKEQKKQVKAPRQNRRFDLILAIAIGIVTLAVFLPSRQFDFLLWDDDVNIKNNEAVMAELSSESVKAMFSTSVIGGYNPLSNLSFAVENHYFGLEPKVFHTTNVLLHVAATLLVFLLFRKLGLSLFVSSLVALLFGIHPMRIESVAWITERKDVLYSFFFLIASILYISYYQTRKWYFYILSLLVFVLSLLSKIQAVSLPLALILIDYHFEGRFRFRQVWNKAPYFLLSLATGIAGIYFLQQQGSLETDTIIPLHDRAFVGSFSFLVYVVKAIFPYQMSAIYPFPANLNWMHYSSMGVVLILAFLIWKMKRWRKEMVFGSLFFLVNVMFVLQVVGAGQGYIADRFTYLPYIGLFFLVAWFLEQLGSGKMKIPVYIGTAAYVILMLAMTSNHLGVWKNTETLFSNVLEHYPNVAVAHNNMGKYFREGNNYEKAIYHYTEALRINPEGWNTYSNRGKALFDLGRADEALADLNKSLEINPDFDEALSNRGAVLSSKGMFAESLADLEKAIKINPQNTTAYSNRSLTFYNLRQYDRCIEDINTYLRFKPNDADMINMRALSYSNLGRDAEAMADFNQAIVLNPRQGVFYQNRSLHHNKMGDRRSALVDIQQAAGMGVQINQQYLLFLQQNQ